MSFFAKVKQWLGMVGVDVKVNCPDVLEKDAQQLTGTVMITSKSDQLIETVNVKFEEIWERGKGEDKKVETIRLGEAKVPVNKPIKAGESQNIDFNLVFTRQLSTNQSMAQAGGVIGGLGKLGSFMDSEKSTYEITATADLKGVALDPTDSKVIIFKK